MLQACDATSKAGRDNRVDVPMIGRMIEEMGGGFCTRYELNYSSRRQYVGFRIINTILKVLDSS